jgi:hypothetical protein
MFTLRHTLTLGLLLCTSALSGCLFLSSEEPDDDVACPAIYELCPEGSVEVEACAPGARCVTKNTCGGAEGTICQYEDDVQCKALPVCGEGEVEIGRCGQAELCAYECAPGATCRTSSICGETVFCQQDNINCRAIPVCPEGTTEVEQCPADTSCSEHSICGVTIKCAKDINNCEAYPSCPEGAVEVESCNDLYICSTATLCGQTIQCEHRGDINCDPIHAIPVCPEGFSEVPDCADDGSSCQYVTTCGTTIACQEDVVNCLAIPVCPAGSQEVMACPPTSSSCQNISLCGTTISCQYGAACAPQDARGVGLCAAFFGYAWNGSSCIGLSGCSCEGADCDEAYETPEACQMARSSCAP